MKIIEKIEKEILFEKFLKYKPSNFDEMVEVVMWFNEQIKNTLTPTFNLNTPIRDLDLSVRCTNAFANYFLAKNIKMPTLSDILKYKLSEIKKWNMMGDKSIKEIQMFLNEKGLSFTP